MYSTTGLAVGMAIGVPTLVFILVTAGFWYRQKLKYKKDLEGNGQDEDDALDLDLDHIIDTPKESHIKDFSTDDLVKRVDAKNVDVDNNDLNDREPDGPVVIRAGDRSFRKSSKIMGLRLLNKDEHDKLQKLPPNKRNTIGKNYSPSKLSQQQSTENFKAFYQSMIPVLPDETLNSGNTSKHASSASLGGESMNESNNIFNNPTTPMKNGNVTSQSNNDLYKLLQDDTPMNPKVLGEIPLRYSKLQSPTPSISQQGSKGSSIHNDDDYNGAHELDHFDTPVKQANLYTSPFDTPPSNKRFQLQNMDFDSENEQDFEGKPDDEDESDIKEDSETNEIMIDHFNDSIPQSLEYESSSTRTNFHRRLNSNDSHLIIEVDRAEEKYNQKRREWLDSYRKV